jgi:biopolymer transport protein ExbD
MAMRFEKKGTVSSAIPTASLPDIVFLLQIFFMTCAVFKEYSGLPIRLPAAKQIEKLPGKRDIAYVWMDRGGRISIDDKIVHIDDVYAIMYTKRADPLHPIKVTSLKVDERLKMEQLYKLQDELRKADALNINYSARTGT